MTVYLILDGNTGTFCMCLQSRITTLSSISQNEYFNHCNNQCDKLIRISTLLFIYKKGSKSPDFWILCVEFDFLSVIIMLSNRKSLYYQCVDDLEL